MNKRAKTGYRPSREHIIEFVWHADGGLARRAFRRLVRHEAAAALGRDAGVRQQRQLSARISRSGSRNSVAWPRRACRAFRIKFAPVQTGSRKKTARASRAVSSRE